MSKNIFRPYEPFTPKKRYSAPAPRPARTFARIMSVLIAVLLVVAAIALIYSTSQSSAKWTDEEALAKIDGYWEKDEINLNLYLEDKGYGAMGSDEEYVYAKGSKRIVISILGNDDFRVGNGEGTTRQYGVDSDVYKCRLCWTRTFGQAREIIVLNQAKCNDVYLPASAVAEGIRLANR